MHLEKAKLDRMNQDLQVQKGSEKDLVKVNGDKTELMRKKKMDFNDRDMKLNDKMKRNDKIEKQLESVDNEIKDEQDKLIISSNELKKLINEVDGYKKVERANEIYKAKLEKDNFKQGKDCTETGIKCLEIKNTIQAKDEVIQQLKKKNSEFEEKLKQQISMYEAVRADLNMFNKNLLEFHQDISKLKSKFKSVNYQIKQLKDEIFSRDSKLHKE